MGLLEDFEGTDYAKYSLALYNYGDSMSLYDIFRQNFPQKEKSRCLAMAIWVAMLNDPKHPSTTRRELAHILSKGVFAIDRAKITKGPCNAPSNCLQNHPIFQLNPEETVIFASLMKYNKPLMFYGSLAGCYHLTWDAIIVRNNLGLHDLRLLQDTCNFDIQMCGQLVQAWRSSERSLMDCKKEYKNRRTQNLLTKIESLQDTLVWTVEYGRHLSELVIQIPDDDLFQRVSGLTLNYKENALKLLLENANKEMRMKNPSVYTRRLVQFVEAGIINHTTGYKTYTNRDLPFLVELISLRHFRVLDLMFSLGASPYIQDSMGLNLYAAVETNRWWVHKYKNQDKLERKLIMNYAIDRPELDELSSIINKYKNRWSPQNHLGFNLQFRSQVKTILLVNNRMSSRLPRNIIKMIFQCLAAIQDKVYNTMNFLKTLIIDSYAKSYPQLYFAHYFEKFGYETKRLSSRSESAQILVGNAYAHMSNEYINDLTHNIEVYLEKHKDTSPETLKLRIFNRGAREVWDEKLVMHAAIMKYIPMKVLKKYINFRDEAPLKRRKI